MHNDGGGPGAGRGGIFFSHLGSGCGPAGVAAQGVDGLLPQPAEGGSHARGLPNQPQLAHLLRYVLCNSSGGADTAARCAPPGDRCPPGLPGSPRTC